MWQFLKTLIETVESEKRLFDPVTLDSTTPEEREEFKLAEDVHLFRNTIKLPNIEEVSDTGSSSIKYDYT